MDQYKALELSPSNNMKKSLIVTALSLILYVPAHANEPPKTPQESLQKERLQKLTQLQKVNQEARDSSFEKHLEEYLKKDKAYYTLANPVVMKMSREDKKRYYFAKEDEIVRNNNPHYAKRFYLLDLEPEFSESEFQKHENIILILARKTIELIKNLEPFPDRADPSYLSNFPFSDEPFSYTFRHPSESKEPPFASRIINAEDYEWAHNLFNTVTSINEQIEIIATYLRKGNKNFNLSDFEYQELDTPEFKKRRAIERSYESLYLYIKAAGLIRNVPSAFYPKSFLREYAYQTGLTKFIVEAETKAGEQLKHDELAEQFFGSYNEWMTGFEQFLQNKI